MKSLLLVFMASALWAQSFSDHFTGKTLRVDYYHTGTKGQELFALDQLYEAGEWAGTRTHMITPLNLGEYQVRMYDAESGKLVYSRGYSTVFNEWQTTAGAKEKWHTFHETWQLPMPKNKIELAVARRNAKMEFDEIWRTAIDPNDRVAVSPKPEKPDWKVTAIMQNGDPATKVDLVIVGDGYAEGDMVKFRRDARHFNDELLKTEPFKSRKDDFNVWIIEVISGESGIPKPDKGIWKNSALGCEYNTFGSARYILTEDNKALRDAAGLVPYDYVNILINDDRYGGGGIYNLYTTTYAIPDHPDQAWQMDYVYVHEFGHSFAGLGDEYYSSQISYEEFYKKDVEPWERNVTALLDKDNLKWENFVAEDTPLPTPWQKALYDSLAFERGKLDRLAADYYEKREPYIQKQQAVLDNIPWSGKTGAFEGAGYEQFGLYRPSVDCRMFSLSMAPFDPVCAAALEEVIDYFTK